jgi:hypothetical protein
MFFELISKPTGRIVMAIQGDSAEKQFPKTVKKHAQSTLANTLKDSGHVNWCHRLAIKPTQASQGD